MHEDPKTITDKRYIIAEAARCVACNLCLPHCPTYQLSQVESESPRGRISLLAAMASGQLAPDNQLSNLLDHCLLCGSCELHCPSTVSFTNLMDKGRSVLKKELGPSSYFKRLTSALTTYFLYHPDLIRRTFRITGRLATELKFINTRFNRYLPSLQPHKRWKKVYPAGNDKKSVHLFLGCVSRGLDSRTLDETIYVLNFLGYSVNIPDKQSCCGALSLHSGDEINARHMMQKNTRAFSGDQKPIIYTATGCGLTLQSSSFYTNNHGFPERMHEVVDFIEQNWPIKTKAVPSRKMKIMLHTPCSSNLTGRNNNAIRLLLKRFQNIKIENTDSLYNCCGAAGTRMLVDDGVAEQLRSPILEQLASAAPDILLSSNIGCALHLSEGLRAANINIPVMHPISLIAQLLRETGTTNEL